MYLHDALRDASVIREMFLIKDPEPKEDLSDVDLRHVSGVTWVMQEKCYREAHVLALAQMPVHPPIQ
jgi:hypothetical protein